MNPERESPGWRAGPEPIFGALANLDARVARLQEEREGVSHRGARSPLDPRPGEPITLYLSVGPAQHAARAFVYWTTDGSPPAGAHGSGERSRVTPMAEAGVEWDLLTWGYVRRFAATLPGQPEGTIVRYRIGVQGPEGELAADDGASYALLIDENEPPAWSRDAVIYHVFVDRFFPGAGRRWKRPEDPSGFFGGTLQGVREKLDYLDALGVNTLYLSPIFPSPSYHGYDATDYFAIEPRVGTIEDFLGLAAEAHARGMRVLLDFVPNHWSALHPTFQAARRDPTSPYVAWYEFARWPDEYATFFSSRGLPKLDLREPSLRRHLLDAAVHWLEAGADGYRIDYAVGPAPDFWADFRRETRVAKADCWSFGEVVESPAIQLGFAGSLDGSLDFALCEALRATFATSRWNAFELASFVERHEEYFPASFSRPSFLDNHDMDRFLWVAGGNVARLKAAALCQFTLSGAPIIYYGTEVGLSQQQGVFRGGGAHHAEARRPMLWGADQNHALLNFYQALIDLRRREPVLRYGTWHSLTEQPDVFAYERQRDGRTLAVLLNLASGPRRVGVPAGFERQLLATDPTCRAWGEGAETKAELGPLAGIVLSVKP